jgi:hypothetical protein
VSGPLWVRWVFALLFTVLAGHCALRLGRRARGGAPCPAGERSADLTHLTMSAVMVVMFLPLPSPVAPVWWAVLFGAQSLWWASRLVPRPATGEHPLAHLVASVVMTGMFAVLPADGLAGPGSPVDAVAGHAGHLSASSPVLALAGWVATAYFLGQTLVCGVRVAAPHPEPPAAGRVMPGSGSVPVRLLMGLGMSYMLLTML